MTGSRVYDSKPPTHLITPLTPKHWKGVLNSIRKDELLDISSLRQLSYSLFNESEGTDYHIRVRQMRISQWLYRGGIDDVGAAWDELLAWMEELGIDEEEIEARAKPKKESTIEDEEPSSPYGYDESGYTEEPEYTTVSTADDTTALMMRAARFEKGEEAEQIQVEQPPELTQELVALIREKAEELSNMNLPEPVQTFLLDGAIEYSYDNPPYEFWNYVRGLLTAEMGVDGELTYLDEPPEISDLIHAIIADKERWVPIDELPEVMHDLVIESRSRSINLLGGNFSWLQTDDGCLYDDKSFAHIRSLVADGLIRYSQAPQFWSDLKNLLFHDDPQKLVSLALPVIERLEEWIPLKKMPKKKQELVRKLRTKAVESYINGECYPANLRKLLMDGSIVYTRDCPARDYWHKVRRELSKPHNHEPPWVMDVVQPAIEERERWTPIEKIPAVVCDLVKEARIKAIDLYGGNFRGKFETIDGWKSGSLACSPVRFLVWDGAIQYSTKHLPETFFRRCEELLFGVERMDDGRYRRVEVPDRIANMLAPLRKEGVEAWNASAKGSTVFHPGTMMALGTTSALVR